MVLVLFSMFFMVFMVSNITILLRQVSKVLIEAASPIQARSLILVSCSIRTYNWATLYKITCTNVKCTSWSCFVVNSLYSGGLRSSIFLSRNILFTSKPVICFRMCCTSSLRKYFSTSKSCTHAHMQKIYFDRSTNTWTFILYAQHCVQCNKYLICTLQSDWL